MATNVGQELTAFSLMQEHSKLANGQNGYDSNLLDIFTKTAEVYERELKRVFGSLVNTVTKIDSVTGQAQRIRKNSRRREGHGQGYRGLIRVFCHRAFLYEAFQRAEYRPTGTDAGRPRSSAAGGQWRRK